MSTDRPLCGAPKRQGVGTCTQPAGWGTNHSGAGPCKLHGGSLPTVAASSKRELIEYSVRGELRQRGWEPVTDPLAAYADLTGEVWAFKEVCRERIAGLSSWTHHNDIGSEDTKAEIVVYERALDRAAKSLVDMLKLGLTREALTQARQAPDRRMAERFSSILDAVLAGLELTPEQRGMVPGLLAAAVSTTNERNQP